MKIEQQIINFMDKVYYKKKKKRNKLYHTKLPNIYWNGTKMGYFLYKKWSFKAPSYKKGTL